METTANIPEPAHKPANAMLSAFGWVAFALVGYLLCTGPDLKVMNNRRTALSSPVLTGFCAPAAYLYWHTPLQRPLGLYWRAWDPADFDDKGHIIFYVVPD